MGKTTRWESTLEAARDALCPDCDSLGPHEGLDLEDAGEYAIECIDCGAVLGHWTPAGMQTCSVLESQDQASTEPLHPTANLILNLLSRQLSEDEERDTLPAWPRERGRR